MSEKRKYDATVARIAGNVASGLLSGNTERIGLVPVQGESRSTKELRKAVAWWSVKLAREIIAEVERTEPEMSKENAPSPRAGDTAT